MAQIPLRFPPLRSVLYDQTPLDEPILVTSTVCAPRVRVRPAVLASLWHRGRKSAVLLGKRIHDLGSTAETKYNDDAIGGEWTVEFDTFDAGNGEDLPKPGESTLSLRAYRPYIVKVVPDFNTAVPDALDAWFNVQSRFRARNFVTLFGKTEPLANNRGIRLILAALAPSVTLVFRRVPTLAFLQTALLKRLRHTVSHKIEDDGQRLSEEMQYGLLTLNETRKAVLLAEDDPMAYKVPVVGIWFSNNSFTLPSSLASTDGQTNQRILKEESEDPDHLNHLARAALRDPAIFAGCIRYACNDYLAERVCPMDSPRTFLVCLLLGGVPLFLECSISTLDGSKILDRYQIVLEYALPQGDSEQQKAPEIYDSCFTVPENIVERVEFKRMIEDEMKQSEFRMEWMTPAKVPNSNALLKQIEEAMEEQAEARRQAIRGNIPLDMHVSPIPHNSPTALPLPENAVEEKLETSDTTTARASTGFGRTNLLVDFIAKQQQEILDLRRIVQRLEETVLCAHPEASSGGKISRTSELASEEQTPIDVATKDQPDDSSVASFEFTPSEGSRARSDSDEDVSAIEARYLALINSRTALVDAE